MPHRDLTHIEAVSIFLYPIAVLYLFETIIPGGIAAVLRMYKYEPSTYANDHYSEPYIKYDESFFINNIKWASEIKTNGNQETTTTEKSSNKTEGEAGGVTKRDIPANGDQTTTGQKNDPMGEGNNPMEND